MQLQPEFPDHYEKELRHHRVIEDTTLVVQRARRAKRPIDVPHAIVMGCVLPGLYMHYKSTILAPRHHVVLGVFYDDVTSLYRVAYSPLFGVDKGNRFTCPLVGSKSFLMPVEREDYGYRGRRHIFIVGMNVSLTPFL